MKRLARVVAAVVTLLTFAQCSQNRQPASESASTLVADTITYMVYVRPQDPSDEYEVAYVSHLDVDLLIDRIYDSVYKNGAKAYDYFEGFEFTLDSLKSREIEDPRFSRDQVSVIQFTEEWRYDEKNMHFDKKVLKIHVAYGLKDEYGVTVANRPGFVIEMNN